MSGMRITLQRLGAPIERTDVEGGAVMGDAVTWKDGDTAPDEPAVVGTSDDFAAPPPPRDSTARLAPASDHPRVSARGERPQTVRIVVIVPFREDGSGRASQLSALLARLRAMFLPGECLAVVAEQADDGRKFNRGQLLNAAFAHVRETHAASLDARETLYCFHDCDMLPDASLAAHYLRGPPALRRSSSTGSTCPVDVSKRNDDPSSSSSVRGFVRVLCADGGRYDADACFGGVTIYDCEGFEATNGYPNGFWGWGGEDNAQFLRCARAGLALERVRGCPFEDLEGLATAAEKLARLDEAGARCGTKEKKRLLKENARNWRADGLTSAAYDAVRVSPRATPTSASRARDLENGDPAAGSIRVTFRLRAAIADEVVCAECGERKGPSGFASHQYKRAMFYAARDGNSRSVARASGKSKGDAEVPELNPPPSARESFWRERNRIARLCHWDERAREVADARVPRDAESAGAPGRSGIPETSSLTPSTTAAPGDCSVDDVGDRSETREEMSTKRLEEMSAKRLEEMSAKRLDFERRFRLLDVASDGCELRRGAGEGTRAKDKRAARCLACVAKDPRVSESRTRAERNAADASRTTCERCGARFEKRNKLFEHLKMSPCGVRDGEVIEGHVSIAAGGG